MKRRLLMAVVLAAAAGGLAAGLLLARDGGTARAAGPPGVVARGTFHSLGWGTSGQATVVRDRSGALTVRLGRDFYTQKAPALWVFVGKYRGLHASQSTWRRLGQLKSWFGAQRYTLHTTPVNGDSVIVFCGKCDRAFGAAPLRFG
jgi:Electron transfer DM13